jgi:hypothetical protein
MNNNPKYFIDDKFFDGRMNQIPFENENIDQTNFILELEKRKEFFNNEGMSVNYSVDKADETIEVALGWEYVATGYFMCVCGYHLKFDQSALSKKDKHAYPSFIDCGLCGSNYRLSHKKNDYVAKIIP